MISFLKSWFLKSSQNISIEDEFAIHIAWVESMSDEELGKEIWDIINSTGYKWDDMYHVTVFTSAAIRFARQNYTLSE